jgi:hypothetical protein
MLIKNIIQKINIKTDILGLGVNVMETPLTDKVAIEKMARNIIKKHLQIDVLANYIVEENIIIINQVGV